MNVQTVTDYTLSDADTNTAVFFSTPGAITVTLPGTLAVNDVIEIIQGADGTIFFNVGPGASLFNLASHNGTSGQYSVATLLVVSNADGFSAEYVLSGNTATVSSTWNPLNLPGIYQWFDAQNAASITQDGSNNVTQWNDLSGQGGTMTAGGTSGPLYVASAINSHPAMEFSPSQGLLNNTDHGLNYLAGATGATMILVAQYIPSGNGWASAVLQHIVGNNSNNRIMIQGYESGDTSVLDFIFTRIADSDSTYQSPWGSWIPFANTPNLLYVSINYETGVVVCNNTLSGTPNTYTLPATGAVSDTPALAACVGGRPEFQNGGVTAYIGEMIFVRGSVAASMSQLQTYLSNKWGVS